MSGLKQRMAGYRSIELGSYGARRTDFGTWIYGTGIAEPCFSKCRSLLEQNLRTKKA